MTAPALKQAACFMLRLGAGTGGNKVQLPSKGNRGSGGLGFCRAAAHIWDGFRWKPALPSSSRSQRGKKKRKKSWKMSSVILDPFCNFTASLSEKFPTEITQRAGASSSFTQCHVLQDLPQVPVLTHPTAPPGPVPSTPRQQSTGRHFRGHDFGNSMPKP